MLSNHRNLSSGACGPSRAARPHARVVPAPSAPCGIPPRKPPSVTSRALRDGDSGGTGRGAEGDMWFAVGGTVLTGALLVFMTTAFGERDKAGHSTAGAILLDAAPKLGSEAGNSIAAAIRARGELTAAAISDAAPKVGSEAGAWIGGGLAVLGLGIGVGGGLVAMANGRTSAPARARIGSIAARKRPRMAARARRPAPAPAAPTDGGP